jgi:hypothetical protein
VSIYACIKCIYISYFSNFALCEKEKNLSEQIIKNIDRQWEGDESRRDPQIIRKSERERERERE